MGLSMFGGYSSCGIEKDAQRPLPNPNPRNFQITEIATCRNYLVVKIYYPDCTNFEGRKILVFKDVSPKEIAEVKEIDPHFCEGKHISPVARFVPTKEGWKMALAFCQMASSIK